MQAPKKLVVATLNYCDIMNNPFEFYCAEFQKEYESLSQIFVALIAHYLPAFDKTSFAWKMGKIDQKIRIGRYSPAFDSEAGILDNAFITKEKFDEIWQQRFSKIPQAKTIPYSEEQRITTRLYDFLFYHALLQFVYKEQPFAELIKNDPEPYRKLIQPFYNLSFLDEDRKHDKMMASFANISADLFFIQEYSQKFQQAIDKTGKYYTINDESKDTLIIAKKLTFNVKYPANSVLSEAELKNLNWADRSAIAVLDRYIIINAHLSSKADKNKIQIGEMKDALLQLKKKHPNHFIITGGDLNSFLGNDAAFEQQYDIYPKQQSQMTTVKKRTMVQGQYHKGNKLVAESKDKIISSLPIQKSYLRYINNEQPNTDSLIPTNEHPFDHYVVVVELKRP